MFLCAFSYYYTTGTFPCNEGIWPRQLLFLVFVIYVLFHFCNSESGQNLNVTGRLSVKTDIYGFGVVLLETLTGLRAWDVMRPLEQRNLVNWASPFLAKRSELKEVMDPRLEQKYPLEAAFKCALLTLRCVAYEPKDRPSSEEVLRSLEQIYADSK